MRVLLAAIIVLVATAAAAQEHQLGSLLRQPPLYSLAQPADPYPMEAEKPHEHDDTAMWVHVAVLSGDWSVTAICAKLQCAPNAYGYVRGVDPSQQTKASWLALSIDGGVVYVTREFVQPDHPKIAAAIMYGLSVYRLITMTHKAGDLRRNTTRSAPPGT